MNVLCHEAVCERLSSAAHWPLSALHLSGTGGSHHRHWQGGAREAAVPLSRDGSIDDGTACVAPRRRCVRSQIAHRHARRMRGEQPPGAAATKDSLLSVCHVSARRHGPRTMSKLTRPESLRADQTACAPLAALVPVVGCRDHTSLTGRLRGRPWPLLDACNVLLYLQDAHDAATRQQHRIR